MTTQRIPAATRADDPPLVLIAEDSAVHRLAMTAMLERSGFSVVATNDGAEALRQVARRRPDVVVVDALMPVMSGFEAIAELRRRDDWATIPTIVVSGLDDIDSRVEALSIGADDFVMKPVHADELVARIRAQLRITEAWRSRSATEHVVESDELAAWLHDVLEHGAFHMHFQPVIDTRSGQVHAQEALARFTDGTRPDRVFHAAARLDRLIELELALVNRAITDAGVLATDVALHVNVSPAAAMDPALHAIVDRADRRVVLEITEQHVLDPDQAMALRAAIPDNCAIAADDVGAGYAGMAQLLNLRPEIVKIDRAVIAGIDGDRARQALVAGLYEYSSATGATLIAEGIERQEEADAVAMLGIHLVQGYFFGRPSSLTEPPASGRQCAGVVPLHV